MRRNTVLKYINYKIERYKMGIKSKFIIIGT